MKSLKQQLLEFAARKAISKAIDIAAFEGTQSVKKRMRTPKGAARLFGNNATIPNNPRKYHDMSYTENARFKTPTAGRNHASDSQYNKDEPVELWVNTVIVQKKGDTPIRLLMGRPLRFFNPNRDVTTSNEEFNKDNAMNNSFVKILVADAENLGFGETKYYGVKPPVEKDDELIFDAGIYFELRRELRDPAADAAAKADIEAAAENDLRGLFG